ncbi:hypothetical protein Tco_0477987, partial [Tanacetum coccineum]
TTDSFVCPVYYATSFGNQEPRVSHLIKMFPRRSEEGEELEYPFFMVMYHLPDEWRDYRYGWIHYEGPPIIDADQYEEYSMPVYDTDIR